MSLIDLLASGAEELGIELSSSQIELFVEYLDNLKSWNRKMNLTAIRDDREIVINHLLDSISIAPLIEDKRTLLDIGSGGGFPGIPLKIVRPNLRVTLLDSVNKKVSFLKDTTRKLGLKDIEAIWGRAEDIENKVPRRHFDYAVNRAVGSVSEMVMLSTEYVSDSGAIILMRGKKGSEEWAQVSSELSNNYVLKEYRKLTLPYSDSKRTVIILKPKR